MSLARLHRKVCDEKRPALAGPVSCWVGDEEHGKTESADVTMPGLSVREGHSGDFGAFKRRRTATKDGALFVGTVDYSHSVLSVARGARWSRSGTPGPQR